MFQKTQRTVPWLDCPRKRQFQQAKEYQTPSPAFMFKVALTGRENRGCSI